MRDLSVFMKEELMKSQLFMYNENDYKYIDSIDEAEITVAAINCGNYMNLIFNSSNLKNYFIDKLLTSRQDTNLINCNCSKNRFDENSFDGLLVFDNVLKCKHPEILNEIKNHKGIFIC
jgi:hypothetical protein